MQGSRQGADRHPYSLPVCGGTVPPWGWGLRAGLWPSPPSGPVPSRPGGSGVPSAGESRGRRGGGRPCPSIPARGPGGVSGAGAVPGRGEPPAPPGRPVPTLLFKPRNGPVFGLPGKCEGGRPRPRPRPRDAAAARLAPSGRAAAAAAPARPGSCRSLSPALPLPPGRYPAVPGVRHRGERGPAAGNRQLHRRVSGVGDEGCGAGAGEGVSGG